MEVAVEKVDTRSVQESLLRELNDLYDVLDDEEIPGNPPTPFAQRAAEWRRHADRFPINRWILRSDGAIVATAVTRCDTEQNLDNGYGRIAVHPDHRGNGHARALATPMFDHLENDGRTRFETWMKRDTPTEELAEKVGLKRALSERLSRLWIDDLDRNLMRQWIERASQRASDYELLYMSAPFPEEHLERFCEMMTIMNTAPLEDYEMEDEHFSPDDWRDIEKSVLSAESQLHNVTAVHKPTGEFVGFTQMKTQGLQPDLAHQWDTGVHPDHRNRGIGRWVKAAMIERILEEYPQVKRVETDNAASNDAMLSINVEMGFKPIHDGILWQGDLATVRELFRA